MTIGTAQKAELRAKLENLNNQYSLADITQTEAEIIGELALKSNDQETRRQLHQAEGVLNGASATMTRFGEVATKAIGKSA